MLSNGQIKLFQIAVKAAGIRVPGQGDGRYRWFIAQYRDWSGRRLHTCKDMNRWQFEDAMAICESMGFRHPGKPETFYRDRVAAMEETGEVASFAQVEVIKNISGNLGMTEENLKLFTNRMAGQECLHAITPNQAWRMIEALKNMLSRRDGVNYETVADAASAYNKEAKDGEKDKRPVYNSDV